MVALVDGVRAAPRRIALHNSSPRLLSATELLSFVPEDKKDLLLKTLSLPEELRGANGLYMASDVYAHLKKLDEKQINDLIDKIKKIYHETVTHLGGGDSDLIIRLNYMVQSDSYRNTSVYSLFDQIDKPALYGIATVDQKRDVLARLETALVGISEIPPETWVKEALSGKIDPTSKFYFFMCQSGVWTWSSGSLEDTHRSSRLMFQLEHCRDQL